jgi:hypothetical protein
VFVGIVNGPVLGSIGLAQQKYLGGRTSSFAVDFGGEIDKIIIVPPTNLAMRGSLLATFVQASVRLRFANLMKKIKIKNETKNVSHRQPPLPSRHSLDWSLWSFQLPFLPWVES